MDGVGPLRSGIEGVRYVAIDVDALARSLMAQPAPARVDWEPIEGLTLPTADPMQVAHDASGITQPGGPPVQWRGWRAAIVGEGGAEVGYVELTFLQALKPMAALGGGRATLTGHMTLADRAFDIVHLDGTTHAVYERVPDWSTPPEGAAGARELPATESRPAQPGAELGQPRGGAPGRVRGGSRRGGDGLRTAAPTG